MMRREMLKASVSALATVPGLSASGAALLPPLGSKPVHSATDFRKAFDEYLAAYATFVGKEYDEPEFDSDEENNAYWSERADSCAAWRKARRALTKMVLEANGFDPDGNAPNTVSAASVDLGDVTIVVGGDPDYEGSIGCRTGLYLAGKTPAMRARLNALPVWKDSGCDTSQLLVGWHRSFLKPSPDRDYRENDVCVTTDH
jgi:hypothetical protein